MQAGGPYLSRISTFLNLKKPVSSGPSYRTTFSSYIDGCHLPPAVGGQKRGDITWGTKSSYPFGFQLTPKSVLTYDRPQTSLACTIFFDWQGLNNCRLNSCCAVSLPDCIAEICGQFFVAGDGTEIMAERACKIARQSDLSCVIKSCTRTSRVSYPHSNSKWYPGARPTAWLQI